jgi:hypothetical protein
MTTEQRTCLACGAEFTWTSAAPRQRFCSTRCKHQWWGTRRRQAVAALSHGDRAVWQTPRALSLQHIGSTSIATRRRFARPAR